MHEIERKLKNHGHYINHPQMIPFIGENYTELNRLLIIGESHYLHNSNNIELKNEYSNIIDSWYSINKDDIILKMGDSIGKDIIQCTNTRANLYAFMKNCRNLRAYTIFKNVSDVIWQIEYFKEKKIEPFNNLAYMNFFQRPAEYTGEKINPKKEDISIAREVFCHVVQSINPNFIFVVSSNAWQYISSLKFDNIIIGHSCHPACAHWNRKSKKYTNYTSDIRISGKKSFYDFLVFNKIFEKF